MPSTAQILFHMAATIDLNGLHRGEQFGDAGTTATLPRLDISAMAYVVAENIPSYRWPEVFYTDAIASFTLIEGCEPAMAALRAISTVLDTDVNETNGQPDYIEHVSAWAMTPPLGAAEPPSTAEVIGRVLRAANRLDTQTAGTRPGFTDAYGLCITCRGHGSLMVDGEEIPYEELSPRRKQGHDLGHRFYRNTSKPCPHCDGQDRVTDAAVSAYEASL